MGVQRFDTFNKPNAKKSFDIFSDYDAIFSEFYLSGICDFMLEDMDFLKFNFILNSLFNQNNELTKRAKIRTLPMKELNKHTQKYVINNKQHY